MRNLFLILALMGAAASLLSCNSQVETALDMAGANQAEKEKVLEHFRDDPALLQYESAVFLTYDKEKGQIWW